MADTGRKLGPFKKTHPITGGNKSFEAERFERIDAIRNTPGWDILAQEVGPYFQHVHLVSEGRMLDVLLWKSGGFHSAKLREPQHLDNQTYVELNREELARVTQDGSVCRCRGVDIFGTFTRSQSCSVHSVAA